MRPITINHMQLSDRPKTKSIYVYHYKDLKEISFHYSNHEDSCVISDTLIGVWKVKIKTN